MPQAVTIITAAVFFFGILFAMIAWLMYQRGKRRGQRMAEELVRLNEIGRQFLRSKLDVDSLVELAYNLADDIVPTSYFQIGLFNGDDYHAKIWIKDGERQPATVFPDAGNKGIIGWVRESGQPLLVHDFIAERAHLPAMPAFSMDSPPLSGLFVPMIAGESTIGIISIQSYQVGRFRENDKRLLTALANQAASAIRHAQLYEHASRRAEQLHLIARVSNQISAVQPLPDIFRQIVALTREAFGYYCVSVLTLKNNLLTVEASTDPSFAREIKIEYGEGLIGWTASSGSSALANNVANDPRYKKAGLLPLTRSEVALPLMVEDKILGVLDVQSQVVNGFTDDDVSALETLASQLALAIEQAEIYDAERRLARRLEALIEVSQAVVSILDLDDLLDHVVELIAEAFGFQRVHIFVRIGDVLVFRAGVGAHSIGWLIDELSYELDDKGLIPHVARTGKPELTRDVSASDDYIPGPGVEDSRSELTVPISMASRVMGVLDVQSTEISGFSDDDLILMQSLADSIAVAMRNAALYANERRRRHLADALHASSSRLAAKLDYEDVLVGVLEGLRSVVELNAAGVITLNENRDIASFYITTGPDLEGYIGFRYPLSPQTLQDSSEFRDQLIEVFERLITVPVSGDVILVPMRVGGELVGALIADRTPPFFLEHGDETIVAFANQAAVALSNARLYAGQQAEAYVTTVLLQVAEAVNAQADLTESLETIARLAALLAGVNRCVIFAWDSENQGYVLKAQYGISRHQYAAFSDRLLRVDKYPLLDLLSIADIALEAGAGHQIPVPEPLSELLPASSVVCLPLRSKSGPVGLLVADNPGLGSNSRLQQILTGIAHQTAAVLETALLQMVAVERERLEQELQVARNIQASFIPEHPPSIPGWFMVAAWEAARLVSGDFYDFLQLPDGLWGLVIADVADKGMPAALFMAVCRTLLRAAAASHKSPRDTLIRVNELLFHDARTDLFVTVFYAIWDPASREVTYSSAGHNPPILYRHADQSVIELPCKGIALGVLETIDLEERTLKLEPGDILTVYTDGITEAMTAEYEQYGVKRLKEELQQADGRADGVLAKLLQNIDEFVGGAPQSDDLTIWMLQCAPIILQD